MLENKLKINSSNKGLIGKYIKNTLLFAAPPAIALGIDYMWVEGIIKMHSQIEPGWTSALVRIGNTVLMYGNLAAAAVSLFNLYQLATNPFRASSNIEIDYKGKTITRTMYLPRKKQKEMSFEKIKEVQVSQNPLEKKLDVGNIDIITESKGYDDKSRLDFIELKYVKSPHQIMKKCING